MKEVPRLKLSELDAFDGYIRGWLSNERASYQDEFEMADRAVGIAMEIIKRRREL